MAESAVENNVYKRNKILPVARVVLPRQTVVGNSVGMFLASTADSAAVLRTGMAKAEARARLRKVARR